MSELGDGRSGCGKGLGVRLTWRELRDRACLLRFAGLCPGRGRLRRLCDGDAVRRHHDRARHGGRPVRPVQASARPYPVHRACVHRPQSLPVQLQPDGARHAVRGGRRLVCRGWRRRQVHAGAQVMGWRCIDCRLFFVRGQKDGRGVGRRALGTRFCLYNTIGNTPLFSFFNQRGSHHFLRRPQGHNTARYEQTRQRSQRLLCPSPRLVTQLARTKKRGRSNLHSATAHTLRRVLLVCSFERCPCKKQWTVVARHRRARGWDGSSCGGVRDPGERPRGHAAAVRRCLRHLPR